MLERENIEKNINREDLDERTAKDLQEYSSLLSNEINRINWMIDHPQESLLAGEDVVQIGQYSNERNQIQKDQARVAEEKRVSELTTGEKITESITNAYKNIEGVAGAGATIATGATTGSIGMVGGAVVKMFQEAVQNSGLGFEGKDIADLEQFMEDGFKLGTFTPKGEKSIEFMTAFGKFLEGFQGLPPQVYPPVRNAMTATKLGQQVSNLGEKVVDAAGVRNLDKADVEFVNGLPDALTIATEYARGKSNRADWVALAKRTDTETVTAAQNLGIIYYLHPYHVTTDQRFRQVAGTAKSILDTGIAAEEVTYGLEIAKRVDDIVKEIGGTDLTTLEKNLRDTLDVNLKSLTDEATILYDKVSSEVPSTTQVNLSKFNNFYDEEVARLGGESQLAKASPQLAKLKRDLTPKEGEVNTFAYVDRIRKNINRSIKKQNTPYAGIESSEAKFLSLLLSEEQAGTAYRISQSAGDYFKMANSLYQQVFSVRDDMSVLFGKALDQSIVKKIKSGISKVGKDDLSELRKILDATPEEMKNEVVLSGLAAAMRKKGENSNPISFENYTSLYDTILKNKEARKLILPNLTNEQFTIIRDLNKVAKGISLASKSKTATGRVMSSTLNARAAESISQSLMLSILRIPARPLATVFRGNNFISNGITRVAEGGQKPVGEFVNKILLDPKFNNLVRSIGTDRQDAAIRELISIPYIKNTVKDPELLIRNAIYTANKETQDIEEEEYTRLSIEPIPEKMDVYEAGIVTRGR